MTTYSGWLKQQEKRDDAVGWFARYWFGLEGRPRLSAVSSITEHLESRHLFEQVEHLTEAHDAAMREYRQMRDGLARPVQDQLPLAETAIDATRAAEGSIVTPPDLIPPPAPESPAQVIRRATQAGIDAGERVRLGSNTEAVLLAILKDLELIKLALGIARDEDGGIVRFPPAVEVSHPPADSARVLAADEGMDWPAWYAQAAHQ